FSTLSMRKAPRWGMNFSWSRAFETGRPRIWSMTIRALVVPILAKRWKARNSAASAVSLRLTRLRAATLHLHLPAGVAAELPGRGELAQLVADHVLDHEHLV